MEKEVNITLVVDRSGSMSSMAKEVIGGINAFIDEQKKLPDPATVTYVQFDNYYEVVYKDKPLAEVPVLTSETFQPRGMTALYDAIGKTLAELNPKNDAAQIIVVMTDGEENSSHEFNHAAVKSVVEASIKKGWKIIFMGANIDAEKVGGGFGIAKGDTVSFAASGVGSSATLGAMSSKMSSMRAVYASGSGSWSDAGGSMSDLYSKSIDDMKNTNKSVV